MRSQIPSGLSPSCELEPLWAPRYVVRKRKRYLVPLLLGLVFFTYRCMRFSTYPDVPAINQTDLLKLTSQELKTVPVSQRTSHSHRDFPFAVGCRVPEPTAPRANAAFVVLARNRELDGVLRSIRSLERHFNQWYQYPWVFLNDEPFTDAFKEAVRALTSAGVEFGVIGSKEWNFPAGVDRTLINEAIDYQGDQGIKYGKLASYHKMCRFYSGWFFKHPLVALREWYWRVEPSVEFFCDITYDPFVEMERRGKKYGFTVMIKELVDTIPNLFRHTQLFIKKHGVVPGEAWELFLRHRLDVSGVPFRGTVEKLTAKVDFELRLERLLAKKLGIKDGMLDEALLEKLVKDNARPLKPQADLYNAQEYNQCHFWLNFEIARTDLFASAQYQAYFDHLDATGGFYSERWGDAPIHSLAVGMFLELDDIHYFRDIGYQHSTLAHCPANARGRQLPYNPAPGFSESLTWRKRFQRLGPPDPTRAYGVGCRCQCPPHHREIEDSGALCLNQWFKHIDDHYVKPSVDLEELRHQRALAFQTELDHNGGRITHIKPK